MLGIMVGQNARVRWIGDGFTGAEHQAQSEHDGEGAGGAGDGGGSGPEKEATGENPADVKPVHQPAGKAQQLARGVSPEKGRQQQAKLVVGEAEVALNVGGAGGKVGAVEVIQEAGNDEQREDAPFLAGQRRAHRSGNHCHRTLF